MATTADEPKAIGAADAVAVGDNHHGGPD